MRSRCCSPFAWPLPHTSLALQILHPHCPFHMEMTTATIHNTLRLSARWLNLNCPHVSPGRCFVTVHELNNGCDGGAVAWREHTPTLTQDDKDSVSKNGSEDTRRLTQNWKSESRISRINAELKCESNLWTMTDPSRGLSFPEEWKSIWEKCKKKKENVYHKEMAFGSGTEKPLATKHKARSSPQWNPVFKMFVPIYLRTRNDILTNKQVSKKILAMASLENNDKDVTTSWFSSKRWWTDWLEYIVTYVLSRLRERLGMDESRMVGSSSYRKWQDIFQYWLKSDGLILYMRANQGHSGGAKVDPTLLDNVGHSLQIELIPLSRRLFPPYALHCSIRIVCKGEKKPKTNCFLHRPESHEWWARGRKPRLVEAKYTEYTPTAWMTYNTVCSQARTDTECVLVAHTWQLSRIVSSLCAWKESVIRSAMSFPCWSLSTSPPFQSTTARSTTWTARPSPRRHCITFSKAHTKNFSKRNPVGNQRQRITLRSWIWECRKPAHQHSHKLPFRPKPLRTISVFFGIN